MLQSRCGGSVVHCEVLVEFLFLLVYILIFLWPGELDQSQAPPLRPSVLILTNATNGALNVNLLSEGSSLNMI